MGLFSSDKPKASPDAKGDQLDSMAGFADLATAVSAAPSSTKANADEIAKPTRGRPTRKPEAPVPAPVISPADAAKEKLRVEAMNVIGKEICDEIAAVPYEVWAFMASDPELRLTDDERKKLAESYFLLAQAINPNFSSPWMIAFALIAKNAVLVGKRLKMEADKSAQRDAIERGDAVIPDRKPS